MTRILPLLLFAACSDKPQDTALTPCEAAAREPLSLSLGTGVAEFVPVEPGDTVPYVLGPQGGFHVWGSLRISGMIPGDPEEISAEDNPIVSYQILYEDGSLLGGFQSLPRGFAETSEANTFEIVGETLLIDIQETDGAEGAAVSMEAEVTDSCESTATATADVSLTFGGKA